MRRLRPDIVFGADLIAGFPTETEAMFAGSMDLVDDCGLTFLHVFPFSPRPGTPAARMPQVARAGGQGEGGAAAGQKGDAALAGHLQAQVGSEVELLMERDRLGRTPGFAEMTLAEPAPVGQMLRARVTGSNGRRLQGEPLAPTCALVSDTPAKSRGLFGLFRRPAAEPAPAPPGRACRRGCCAAASACAGRGRAGRVRPPAASRRAAARSRAGSSASRPV